MPRVVSSHNSPGSTHTTSSVNTSSGGPRGEYIVLTLAVEDTGIGMKPEMLSRLFSPFVQASAAQTRVHGGTGLGLTITKRIVDLMGGQIGVDSTYGVGSTFHVQLKVEAAPAGTEVVSALTRVTLQPNHFANHSPGLEQRQMMAAGAGGHSTGTPPIGALGLGQRRPVAAGSSPIITLPGLSRLLHQPPTATTPPPLVPLATVVQTPNGVGGGPAPTFTFFPQSKSGAPYAPTAQGATPRRAMAVSSGLLALAAAPPLQDAVSPPNSGGGAVSPPFGATQPPISKPVGLPPLHPGSGSLTQPLASAATTIGGPAPPLVAATTNPPPAPAPSGGAAASTELSRASFPNAAGVVPAPAPATNPNTKTVLLVVDDDEVNRKILCRMLAGCGHNLVLASNGLAAVRLMGNELKTDPNISVVAILMDIGTCGFVCMYEYVL